MATKRRTSAARGPGSTNPVDIAMDAEADGRPLDSPTLRLLGKQERLIEAEIELARDARFANRMKGARDTALAVGAVALLGLAGWMVWDAARADDLVLEPWTAPPAFAAQGQGGEVLAAQLGDRLRRLQKAGEVEATGAARAAGGKTADLSLEIPQTGVSIGELQRWLRRALGRQTVVGGSVVQLPDGRLSVTIRPGEAEAASFEGAAADLPALLDKAAEAALRQTDPLRFAGFLVANQRLDEAAAVVEPLTHRGSDSERASAMANMVNILNYQDKTDEALRVGRRAVALDPNNDAAVGYLAGMEYRLGHQEQALAMARRQVELSRRPATQRVLSQYLREENPILWPTVVAGQVGDTRAATEGYRRLAELANAWNNPARARVWGYQEAGAWLEAHDIAGGRAAMPRPPAREQTTAYDALTARRIVAQARADLGRKDEAHALARQTVQLQRQYKALPELRFMIEEAPGLALIFIGAGDTGAAHDLLDASPMDCVPCVRARGVLAAAERDWPRADRFFALATRLAPSIPHGWSAWGHSKAARGELAGALAHLRRAQDTGPGWADPLKFEGDILMRQGKAAQAAKRYALAGERAPKWGALQLAWGDALARAGRRDQAVARWKAALDCEMSKADRAAVKQRLGQKS